MPALIDLTGQQFGRLTVLERSEDYVSRSGHRKLRWMCRCECGNAVVAIGSTLANGHTKSCGCLRRETMARTANEHVNGKELVSYGTAHVRVAWQRGKASLHDCVDCGRKAEQWAYNHDDPDELVQETRVNGVLLHRLRYSLKVECYSPKCRGCNIKDKQTHKEIDE